MMAGERQKHAAIVIPVYNHATRIRDVVMQALALNMPVIVVDDGSTDDTVHQIRPVDEVILLRHHANQGKGAALLTGFAEAAKIADWAVTLDGDGQHHPEESLRLLQAVPENIRPIVIGRREGMDCTHIPWTSRFGRGFSNFWVRMAGGPRVSDSQSGFRLYPLPESMTLDVSARRFQFEVEILVKARRKGIPVLETPVSVTYQPGKERISHFRPFRDFLRNAATFSRLILQRIAIIPAAGLKNEPFRKITILICALMSAFLYQKIP